MSEENEGEENNQKDELTELDDFEFYFRFIKPLVLELPTEEDRGIGAAWAQKLEQIPETEEESNQRLNYVKLLLFVLQRGRLSGIFKKQPPSGPLQPFPQGFSILDMGNWMLDQEDAQTCGGGDAGRVPYDIEISNDLREYAASQEVPNFGVQMYYAWSSEDPVNKWLLYDEDKFPQYILDKIKQLNEIKSDERTTIVKDGCIIRKKGCELNLPEKYSRKRVKSPQEIEKSQGRSYHTYMGLVGRMGNFNDKCDDDPEKYQRQEQRKGKCPKKSSAEKRCVANAGEAEDMAGEEEYDTLVTGLGGGGGGGLNAQNRPCLCPYPFPLQNFPENQAKGGLQPFENQQSAFVIRGNTENFQYTGGRNAPKSTGGPCPERGSFQPSPTMRNVPRQRSESPNIANVNCPPEDDPREFQNQGGVCICSNPPCTCPCPRGTTQGKTRPNATPAAGGVCPEQNRTFDRTSRPDQSGGRRDIGPGLTSFRAPDPCTPMPSRADVSPVGGRTGATTGLKPVNAEIIHCYDSQNPDPALTQTINKNTEWVQCGSSFKFADTNFKIAQERVSLIASARDNRSDLSSRRVLFENQPPDQNIAGPSCQQLGDAQNISPLGTDPLCENSSPEAAYERSPPRSNHMTFCQQQTGQNFQDCENTVDEAPPQTMTRPANQSLYDTNTQDFQKMVEFLKKFKQIAKDDVCNQESQQGQVCPPQLRAPQICKQQPRSPQAYLPQSQPAQVCSQSPRLAQASPQQLRTTQACLTQSQPSQVFPQQPRPSKVCSQQSQPTQVCPQQPRPAQVCPSKSQPAQVSPQSPRRDQVCPQQPQLAQMSPQQPRHDQMCPQQPQLAQMSPQQPRHDQMCPQQPQHAQMSSQQPRHDQVCSQQPQHAQMSPQQPRHDQVCSQQPQHAQMSPQQPRHDQVCSQQPQHAPVSPQQPRRDQLCPQQPQSSHVCSQQLQSPTVCPQQPKSPQTCSQSHQSSQSCSPQPALRAQVCPQSQFTQMGKSVPQPAQMVQQQPRPTQMWAHYSQPAQAWPQQSRRPAFQETFEECTLQCHSSQAKPQSPFLHTTWQEPKISTVEWHEFSEGSSQPSQLRSQSPQAGQGRSQSPQPSQFYPSPLKTGLTPQDGCNYMQESQTLSSTFCPKVEVDQQQECDTSSNIIDNSSAQYTQSDTVEDFSDFCKDLNARQRNTGQQLESTRIGALEIPDGSSNARGCYRQNQDPSHFTRHRAFQQAEVKFPQQNVDTFQQHGGQDWEPLVFSSRCEPLNDETYTLPPNPSAPVRLDRNETMCESHDDWFF